MHTRLLDLEWFQTYLPTSLQWVPWAAYRRYLWVLPIVYLQVPFEPPEVHQIWNNAIKSKSKFRSWWGSDIVLTMKFGNSTVFFKRTLQWSTDFKPYSLSSVGRGRKNIPPDFQLLPVMKGDSEQDREQTRIPQAVYQQEKKTLTSLEASKLEVLKVL